MSENKVFVKVFVVLAICAAAAGVILSVCFLHAEPIMLKRSDGARDQVVSMMDAVCAGDYEAAGQKMYGAPSFGPERDATEDVGILFWNAYSESLSYELVGECYAEDQGVAQNVRITCLDFSSVTENLKARFQVLLEQRIADAKDVSELYDENNNYREDMVMALLMQAAEDCVREDARMITVEVPVKLIYKQGQWWILPEEGLLTAITGGILK